MAIVYITEQGASVRKRGLRIFVEKGDGPGVEIPVFKISRVMIFGNIHISPQAIALLLDSGIDISFHSMSGRLRGVLSSATSRNVYLRVAQQARWQDTEYRLRFAINIVKAKVTNQRAVIKRSQRNHREIDFSDSIRSLEEIIGRLEECGSLQSVMGLEGRASAIYFAAFAQMVRGKMSFSKRVKHPPTDPVNALLSLGYVMLGNEIGAFLDAMALDSYLGFLHGLRYGRKSLAMDLLEEFRQPVIDLFTLNLINLRIFQEKDFYALNGGVRLKEKAFRHYLELFENRLQEQFTDDITGRRLNWRQVIHYQLDRLENALLDNLGYQPYIKRRL